MIKKKSYLRATIIAAILSRTWLTRFNEAALELFVRGLGYNNYHTLRLTGERHFLKHVVAPTAPVVCIDVGAHHGDYSEELLAIPSTHVIAFEPHPGAYSVLKSRFAHESQRFTAVQQGVASSSGEMMLHSGPETPHSSLSEYVVQVPYVNATQAFSVAVTSLDDYCASHGLDHIDLLKIDVEGFEVEVLRGAERILSIMPPKFVQFEFNIHHLFGHATIKSITQMMPGYSLFQLLPKGWRRIDPDKWTSNIFQFSNFVLVRDDAK